jgi:anti-sigma regulatory factor (Ser/Thr protein kinase)
MQLTREPSDRLRLDLPAEPSSVAIVRRELEAHADSLGVPESQLGDLKTILSEACGNTVRYAYAAHHAAGPMRITIKPDGDELEIHVCDQGSGLRPHHDLNSKGGGFGLLLISALSKSLSLFSEIGKGTHLEVRFSIQRPPT